MFDPATPPVDLQTLQRSLRDTEAQIQKLEGEKANLLKRIEALMLFNEGDTKTVEERFELWLKYGVKKDYPWIQHIESKAGVDLLEYDVFIISWNIYWSKCQTITIDRISEKIREMIETLQAPDKEFTNSGLEDRQDLIDQNVTIETCHEWMAELMRLNFGSCVMDW